MAKMVVEIASAMIALGVFVLAQPQPSSAADNEPTDIYIRRLAGLPAQSAEGDIAIVDIGHMPLDPMISIVAKRKGEGWHVRYACAASPRCATGTDHWSEEYDLAVQSGQQVEAIIYKFRNGFEPDGTPPGPTTIACGRLTVVVDYKGFRRTYYRACDWGEDLGTLEALLQRPRG